jgi:hypothetical protein
LRLTVFKNSSNRSICRNFHSVLVFEPDIILPLIKKERIAFLSAVAGNGTNNFLHWFAVADAEKSASKLKSAHVAKAPVVALVIEAVKLLIE